MTEHAGRPRGPDPDGPDPDGPDPDGPDPDGPDPDGPDPDGPDVAAVLADDRLVEAIRAGDCSAADAGDAVAALLLAWRADVDAQAPPVHPDLDDAAGALRAALRAPRRRVPFRLVTPVAGAAAAFAIASAGIGYAAHGSGPGDPLWGVTQTIFADHARSVQAAAAVSAELAQAEAALASGTPAEARAALDKAVRNLPAVASGDGRQALEDRHERLVQRLAQVGAPTPPPSVAPPGRSPLTTSPDPRFTPPAAPIPAGTTVATPGGGPSATTGPAPVTTAGTTTSRARPATSSAPTPSSPAATTTAPPNATSGPEPPRQPATADRTR